MVCISKKYPLKDLKLMILKLAKSLNYTAESAERLGSQVDTYYNNYSPYSDISTNDPLSYWQSLIYHEVKTSVLKDFAIVVMKYVPHAAGVEQLFSVMSYIKTKSRNRMEEDSLTMLAQTKTYLTSSSGMYHHAKKRNISGKEICQYKSMEDLNELTCDDLGNRTQENDDDPVLLSRQNAFIEKLFDFDIELNQQKIKVCETLTSESNSQDWDPASYV
jgi:hypothetical protein